MNPASLLSVSLLRRGMDEGFFELDSLLFRSLLVSSPPSSHYCAAFVHYLRLAELGRSVCQGRLLLARYLSLP